MTTVTRRQTFSLAGGVLATMASSAYAQGAPLKIGCGMALTGGLAAGGKAALLSYQIWADEINAKGGLLGRKIEIVSYDDQSNPSTVPGIYSKLLDIDKVDVVVSGYATVPTAAAMPLIIQRGKMFLSLFALAINDQFNYDRYFQMQPTGPNSKTEFSRGFFELAGALTPRPTTVAMVGADAEFSQIALEGARENAKKAGMKVVYDRTYPPNNQDFGSIVRAIKATNPDLLYIASYPPDSAGMVRAMNEVGFGARMVGGGMIGLQFAAFKQQLGPMLNNLLAYDLYVPEPTMNFPGVQAFLVKYREKAVAAGVDPLGIYIPPFAYAEMQVLEQAVNAVKSLDDKALAEYIHANKFSTIVGDIKFGKLGEWEDARVLLVQYRGVEGNDVEQFKQPGKQVIVHPPKYKSGELVTPFEAGKK
jgi:branched-chain amino acid transport system substrate-binding protein